MLDSPEPFSIIPTLIVAVLEADTNFGIKSTDGFVWSILNSFDFVIVVFPTVSFASIQRTRSSVSSKESLHFISVLFWKDVVKSLSVNVVEELLHLYFSDDIFTDVLSVTDTVVLGSLLHDVFPFGVKVTVGGVLSNTYEPNLW